MKFYKYLYVGETVEHVGILKQKLKIHAMVRVYLVTLACGDDQLEIYSSMLLKQKYFRNMHRLLSELLRTMRKLLQLCRR